MSLRLFFFILFLLLSGHAKAAPTFEVSNTPSRLKTNETFILRISARWPEDEGAYSFLLPQLKLDNLKLLRSGESQEIQVRGERKWLEKSFEFELSGIKPGEGRVKAFHLRYIDSQKSNQEAAHPIPEIQLTFVGIPKRNVVIGTMAGVFLLTALVSSVIMRLRNRQFQRSKSLNPGAAIGAPQQKLKEQAAQLSHLTAKDRLYALYKLFRDQLIEEYHLNQKTYTEVELKREIEQKVGSDPTLFLLIDRFYQMKYVETQVTDSTYDALFESVVTFLDERRILSS